MITETYFLFISYYEPEGCNHTSKIVLGNITLQKKIDRQRSPQATNKYKRIPVIFYPKEDVIVFLTGCFIKHKDANIYSVVFNNISEQEKEGLAQKQMLDETKGKELIDKNYDFIASFIYPQITRLI